MFLSIIIPTYNGEKYIDECIDSVKKIQVDKEVIVVDDGSTNNIYEHLTEMYGEYSDFHIFRKSNGGIVDARNFGLEKAKGDYVIFVDHDDIVCPNVITKTLTNLKNNNADIAIWSTVRLMSDGEKVPCDTVLQHKCEEKVYDRENIKEKIIIQMLTNSNNSEVSYLGHVWQAVYRLNLIKKYKIHFRKFVDIEDDYLFLLDYLCIADTLVVTQNIGYIWRCNKESETYRRRIINDILLKYENMYGYIDTKLKIAGINETQLVDYEIFKLQDTCIASMENMFKVKNGFWRNYKMIRTHLLGRKCIDFFTSCEMIKNYSNKRKRRVFRLLEYRMIFCACLYIYLDDIYRLTVKYRKETVAL